MGKIEKKDVKKVWIVSADGKPVHLVDKTFVRNPNDDYEHISISRDMAAAGVGVEVYHTEFIDQKITEKLIKIEPDKAGAKKGHEEFVKKGSKVPGSAFSVPGSKVSAEKKADRPGSEVTAAAA